ncbi:MAG: DNA repair protein RadA [Elusimicrobia bacterium]|nr:DNA repair protein RadA [Elusimicrobiota bacterium]
MARLKTVYRCQQCGHSASKPMGQCPGCSEWNTMVEEVVETRPEGLVETLAATSARAGTLTSFSSAVVELKNFKEDVEERRPVGIGELDRLLGGGLVAGQVVLLAGPPGIGKSTLMLQAAAKLSEKGPVLYATGEESLRQVSGRAQRLGLAPDKLFLVSETNLAKILATMESVKPWAVILDSVQTASHPQLASSPGSVGQVRECAAELVRAAKSRDTVVFLLGHVTKDGSLAGPKVLEHIVDTVLYFDTERHDLLRVLRAHKNRFGPTDELGLFEMGEKGLREVTDASSFFLADLGRAAQPGRAVSVALEGSRPMLVETQALVVPTRYPLPRRMATGLDLNRVLVLLASMERHLGLHLEDRDAFVSLAGGLRLKDPALDLAACLAVVGSSRDKSVPADMVLIGEVGLLGEIGRVPQLESRLKEAAKAGFKRALVPERAVKDLPRIAGLNVTGVPDLRAAHAAAFGGAGDDSED